MSAKTSQKNHLVLTTNGVAGACAAATVLMKHPEARIQFTSPRHLPKALESLRAERFAGTVHLCGIGISAPAEDLMEALAELPRDVSIVWYAGQEHPELKVFSKRLASHAKLHRDDAQSTVEVILKALNQQKAARALLITELTEEATANRKPRSELHRFCHDLVLAANRRFFFFGEDGLNEQAIRYLAGLEEKSDALEAAV